MTVEKGSTLLKASPDITDSEHPMGFRMTAKNETKPQAFSGVERGAAVAGIRNVRLTPVIVIRSPGLKVFQRIPS